MRAIGWVACLGSAACARLQSPHAPPDAVRSDRDAALPVPDVSLLQDWMKSRVEKLSGRSENDRKKKEIQKEILAALRQKLECGHRKPSP